MQWLAELCVQRPVFAWVLVLSLTVVGLFAFGRLGVDRFPNVDIPSVAVTTRLPGAAPEQIETEVTDKIEEAVNTISGIDTLSSTSSEGVSQVVVAFVLEKNADVAAQEVRDRVNRIIPLLPRTVMQPTVEKLDPTASPVITVAVTAEKPVRDITEFADKVLRRRLESSDGVGQVVVIGGRNRQINLWLDAALLRAQKLSVNDVARALQSQNVDVPGGRIDQGAQSVTLRTRGRDRHRRRIRRRRAARGRRPPGPAARRRPRRRRHGRAAHRRPASTATPTVLLQIRKQSGTNTVEVANNVKQRLAELAGACSRPAISCASSATRRSSSRRRSPPSQEHLIVGSILAAIVVWLFLGNFRSTIIAAISIPTSIIATFALIWYMGFTLNMLTMLALTLSVGIVIDDAIVVLENIYRFIEEKGMPPMQAAVEATREIGLAVHGHDLLAGRDLRAGRLHERHGRPLHAELRPDDGLRRAGVAVRQLHADADDVGALAEAAAARAPAIATRSTTGCSARSIAATRACSSGRWRIAAWWRSARCSCCCRAFRSSASTAVNFTPEDDQSQFDVTLRAPEGTSLAATEVLANRARHGDPPDSRSRVHAGHGGRRHGRHAEHRQRCSCGCSRIDERERDQFAVMAEVRDQILPAVHERAACARRCSAAVARAAAAATFSSCCRARISTQLETLQRGAAREGGRHSRARRRRHDAQRRQARDVGAPRSAEGGRPRRADRRRRRSAAAARRRRSGDDLQRRRRAVRSAPARAGGRSQHRRRRLPACRCRRRGSASSRSTTSPRFARGDSPATISRMGRQRQVTLIANMLPGTSQGGVQQQIAAAARDLALRPRVPRRTSPAARASSIAPPRRS